MSEDHIDIWFLIGSLQIGGANRTLVDLANNLDSEQFDVTVWTILDTNPLATELADNVELQVLGASGKHDFPAVINFIRSVSREQPEIVQSFMFYDNLLARLSSFFSPRTKVLSGVRAVPESPSRVRATIDRLTMPLVDHVVSNSRAGRELAVNRGANSDSVSVIKNGRNLEKYTSATASDEVRENLGIPKDAIVVGTVGRLIKRKGHYDLLEAWPEVIAARQDAHLLLVGDGPERTGLEALTRKLGIDETVTFAGTRDDVPELLDLMDMFGFPSHFEGLPGAVIEAMAAGLPIICTSVAGNTELIEDGVSGVFVPPKSPANLASATATLLDDAAKRSHLGRNAQMQAKSEFTIDAMIADFQSLYEAIAYSRN